MGRKLPVWRLRLEEEETVRVMDDGLCLKEKEGDAEEEENDEKEEGR